MSQNNNTTLKKAQMQEEGELVQCSQESSNRQQQAVPEQEIEEEEKRVSVEVQDEQKQDMKDKVTNAEFVTEENNVLDYFSHNQLYEMLGDQTVDNPQTQSNHPCCNHIIQEDPVTYHIIQEDPVTNHIIQEDPVSHHIIQEDPVFNDLPFIMEMQMFYDNSIDEIGSIHDQEIQDFNFRIPDLFVDLLQEDLFEVDQDFLLDQLRYQVRLEDTRKGI